VSRELLRAGVAGCGQVARHLHIPGYANCPRAKLVALYNHRLETVDDLRQQYPDAEVLDDYERFLDDTGVQAISICTPNALHAEMAIAALRRRIHVLVEKPMAVTLDEGRAMIDAARETGSLLMVGHSKRYVPRNQKAFEIIRSGMLGRIIQVSVILAHSGPLDWSPRGKWFVTAGLAGRGVIGDLAVHEVDLVRYLTGQEVQRVAAFDAAFEQHEVEDNAVAVMHLSGGTLATLVASWTLRGGNMDSLLVIGERGSLRVGVEAGSPLVAYLAPGERRSFAVPREIPMIDGVLQLDQVPEFVEAALGERPNPIPAIEGYRALEVCIAIERSAHTGELVELPLHAY
jgi:predicted dehydrogenase